MRREATPPWDGGHQEAAGPRAGDVTSFPGLCGGKALAAGAGWAVQTRTCLPRMGSVTWSRAQPRGLTPVSPTAPCPLPQSPSWHLVEAKVAAEVAMCSGGPGGVGEPGRFGGGQRGALPLGLRLAPSAPSLGTSPRPVISQTGADRREKRAEGSRWPLTWLGTPAAGTG